MKRQKNADGNYEKDPKIAPIYATHTSSSLCPTEVGQLKEECSFLQKPKSYTAMLNQHASIESFLRGAKFYKRFCIACVFVSVILVLWSFTFSEE